MVTQRKTRARAKVAKAVPESVAPIAEVAPAELVVSAPMVIVGSLQMGDQFEVNGERYRRLSVEAGKVVALHLTNPEKGWIGVTQTAFDLDTMVIKK